MMLASRLRTGLLLLAALTCGRLLAAAKPVVEVEETVTTCQPPNNGAGPFWCYGAPLVVRDADRVFVSAMETLPDVPPLCNTRWRLFERNATGWHLAQAETPDREREPCPLATTGPGRLVLSVNPSRTAPGSKYQACQPHLLQFESRHADRPPQAIEPLWVGTPHFTDHSYRGFAADGTTGDLIALNIDAVTSEQQWFYRSNDGSTTRSGAIRFSIRACYPQVALRGKAAHVLAIGDIVEPNEEWRTYKHQKTGADWDYVFRRLFYTWTPDITRSEFDPPVEMDTVEATAGHITNLDVWLAADGTAHLLYLKANMTPLLRDRNWPGQKIVTTLEHVVVNHGRVQNRVTLLRGEEGVVTLPTPRYARFQALEDGRLLAICAVEESSQNGSRRLVNVIVPALSEPASFSVDKITLKEPLSIFFNATERGGNRPSHVVDLFGAGRDGQSLHYVRVRLP